MYCKFLTQFCFILMLFATTQAWSWQGSDPFAPLPAPLPTPIHAKPQFAYTLRSCDDAIRNGVYQMEIPASGLKPFYVYCMLDESGNRPWTIVQRRMDGSQNFYRNWQDYKNGLGTLYGEFFIGLDILHALTYARPHELWVQLENKDGERRSANYTHFAINDETTKYTLSVLGAYSGDAGDSLTYHAGRKFTTKDQNNNVDGTADNCAVKFTGAWWYRTCHQSNLNGEYGNDVFGKGIDWLTWTGYTYSLKYTHMAIRPIRH